MQVPVYWSLHRSRANRQSFGLGLEGGVSPRVATTQFVNLGLTARYSIHAGPGYAYIGTGYMVSREGIDFQIPIRAGYKFIFSKKFFVGEEFGYYFFGTRIVMQVRRLITVFHWQLPWVFNLASLMSDYNMMRLSITTTSPQSALFLGGTFNRVKRS